MLYSSCYPSRCLAQALAEVRALPLRPDVQQLVLSGNARRLLGLGA
jgi:predicted TIM-barrel fold metal-dependent hydrolase